MTDAAMLCPWCSASLPAADLATCPTCGATLASPTGAEPDIKGVTTLDPMAILQARADVARPRNRLLSFITGETPEEDETANPESIAPPSDDVRREMLRLQLEAERADLEAESLAMRTDTALEQGIDLAQLAAEDAEAAASEPGSDVVEPAPGTLPTAPPAPGTANQPPAPPAPPPPPASNEPTGT